ncbi:MAG: hypothetical protein ABR591_14225 [Candidatus Velthaea sp.]
MTAAAMTLTFEPSGHDGVLRHPVNWLSAAAVTVSRTVLPVAKLAKHGPVTPVRAKVQSIPAGLQTTCPCPITPLTEMVPVDVLDGGGFVTVTGVVVAGGGALAGVQPASVADVDAVPALTVKCA